MDGDRAETVESTAAAASSAAAAAASAAAAEAAETGTEEQLDQSEAADAETGGVDYFQKMLNVEKVPGVEMSPDVIPELYAMLQKCNDNKPLKPAAGNDANCKWSGSALFSCLKVIGGEYNKAATPIDANQVRCRHSDPLLSSGGRDDIIFAPSSRLSKEMLRSRHFFSVFPLPCS